MDKTARGCCPQGAQPETIAIKPAVAPLKNAVSLSERMGPSLQAQNADTDCIAPPYGSNACDDVKDGDEDCDDDGRSNFEELRVDFTDSTNGAACIN